MKVLFINPAVKEETQHPLLNSFIFTSTPLGLGYIAGYLRQKNKVDLKIIDEVVTPLSDSDLTRELENLEEPCIVGISCLTATFSRSMELAKKIKLIRPRSFVIFGGAHPTALPEESLQSGVVDIVVRKEGEVTMKEIYDALIEGANLGRIRGISYLSDGTIQHNPDRDYINLDLLPQFPYDLFEHNIKYYSNFGVILTSRGCPFNCIFCSNRIVTGQLYRTFKTDYVLNEIEALAVKYNQKSIYLIDDNIVANKTRFFELNNAIIKKGLHKKTFFVAQFRGEDMTEEILGQMKKANFRALSCGMETSSDRLMKLLNKNEEVSQIKEGIELSSSAGIITSTTFIFGLPTETRFERLHAAALSRRMPLSSARFNIAIPYPGTRLFEIAQQENRLNILPEWKNFNVQYYLFGDDIPYVPESTGKYTLIFDTMWANLRFYLRLKILMTILLKTDITGGNVISLQNRRTALHFYRDLLRVIFLVTKRFIYLRNKSLQEKYNGRKKAVLLPKLILILGCSLLLVFTFLFFSKVKNPHWIFTGDTINSLAIYSFHYSGIARGEYPLWNPLVRCGDNGAIFQVTGLANPILNLVTVASVLANNKDIIFSFSLFIYIMIVAYVIGIFLLVSCWVNNRFAGLFASIIALGSSSVFFFTYHISFITILYTMPWMLYALTQYVRSFRFRFLLIFALSFCAFLYSYEFTMGLLYIVTLFIPFLIFYGRRPLKQYNEIFKKIPVWHLLTAGSILLIFSLPLLFALYEYKVKLLPISRIDNINITGQYSLTYDFKFTKIFWFPLTHIKYIITLFMGLIFYGFNELRHYVGPLALPFLVVALFSFRRATWCLALSGLLICMLGGNVFPVNLILQLPGFDSIRNLLFLTQFSFPAIIILAGFGFDSFMKRRTPFLKKVFNASMIILVVLSFLSLTFTAKNYSQYNTIILIFSLLVMLVIFYLGKFLPLNYQASSILVVSAISVIIGYALISHIPVLSGELTDNSALSTLRRRDDNLLKFTVERPDDIQKVNLSDATLKKWQTDAGQDEYSSFFTLKDNSYKTAAGAFGLSSYPLLKTYYLFLSLPGHELVMRKKFFYFSKFYVSSKPADMMEFKRNQNLFSSLLKGNIGITDESGQVDNDISLGLFNPVLLYKAPVQDRGKDFRVNIKEYKANSLKLNVESQSTGLFTYTDLWDDAWSVKVDGKQALLKKVFWTFKGIILPKGSHEVEFFYKSNICFFILLMNVVFGLTLLTLLGYFIIFRNDKIKKSQTISIT